MTTFFDKTPFLKDALISLACYNGGINQKRSAERYLNEVLWLCKDQRTTIQDMQSWDKWLSELTDDERMIAVDGEESEREALFMDAPPGLDEWLNTVFEEAV